MDEDIFKERKNGFIVGVGSPLVDILIKGDEALLAESGAVRGGMVYVPSANIDRIARAASSPPVTVTGGSACNTIIGAAKLGAGGRFIGKRGKDELGDFFEEELRRSHVDPALLVSDSPTGRVLSIITPDAQRSMLTDLGASAELKPNELTANHFQDAAIVHLEGYLIFNRELITTLMTMAGNAGALVSLDLSSHTIVKEQREFIRKLAADHVDIIIANEDEAAAYTGTADELKAAEILGLDAPLVVIKLGKRGSLIAYKHTIYSIPPAGTNNIVDTTGAGDLWNSGFFYGLMMGFKPDLCGKIGSLCGYQVCCVMGAKIPESGWLNIKAQLTYLINQL